MVNCKEFKIGKKSTATPGRTPKIAFTCGYCEGHNEGRITLGVVHRGYPGLVCPHCGMGNRIPIQMKEVREWHLI